MLVQFGGASVRRVIDFSRSEVREHAHDWPLLSLFVMGAYTNHAEIGEAFVCGPSAVLYRAGAAHRNFVGPDGFEQIEIEFDPDWLGATHVLDAPVHRWIGKTAAAEARLLARLCGRAMTEDTLRTAVRLFIENAERQSDRPAAGWTDRIARRVRADPSLKITKLATEAGLHPSWLGEAYKRATGEGLLETAARVRVERAAHLLRETDQPCAIVAAGAGFCDQSHMNRTFRRVLGRLPSAVRADRETMRRP